MAEKRIPLFNPVPLPPGYRKELEEAVLQVLRSGTYIGGPQVEALELELAAAAGMPYCAGVSNGTDALWLLGAALHIGPGDVVFVPAFTFSATAEAFALLGATIQFVDVTEETATLCPHSLEQVVARWEQKKTGTPKAVIAVDLFGHPADYETLIPFCRDHQLLLLRDGAQSFGCECPPEWGAGALPRCLSFFPTKPLGGVGDGGAVLLQDRACYETVLSLREHGKGKDRYHTERLGRNARLDAIQAAALRVKLRHFRDDLRLRERLAVRYSLALGPYVEVPKVQSGCLSAWAQYTIRLRDETERERVRQALTENDIGCAVYYPVPLHKQPCWHREASLPVSEKLSRLVLSLPMGPHVTDCQADEVCDVIRKAVAKGGKP